MSLHIRNPDCQMIIPGNSGFILTEIPALPCTSPAAALERPSCSFEVSVATRIIQALIHEPSTTHHAIITVFSTISLRMESRQRAAVKVNTDHHGAVNPLI